MEETKKNAFVTPTIPTHPILTKEQFRKKLLTLMNVSSKNFTILYISNFLSFFSFKDDKFFDAVYAEYLKSINK